MSGMNNILYFEILFWVFMGCEDREIGVKVTESCGKSFLLSIYKEYEFV